MKTYRCVFSDGDDLLVVSSDKARAILIAKELNPDFTLINVLTEDEW